MKLSPFQVVLFAAAAGIGAYGITQAFKNTKKNNLERDILAPENSGNPKDYSHKYAGWATDLKRSFVNDSVIADFFGAGAWGTGTDEALLFNTVEKIPTQKAWRGTGQAYEILMKGKSTLNADLIDELDNKEYAKLKNIIAQKPLEGILL